MCLKLPLQEKMLESFGRVVVVQELVSARELVVAQVDSGSVAVAKIAVVEKVVSDPDATSKVAYLKHQIGRLNRAH